MRFSRCCSGGGRGVCCVNVCVGGKRVALTPLVMGGERGDMPLCTKEKYGVAQKKKTAGQRRRRKKQVPIILRWCERGALSVITACRQTSIGGTKESVVGINKGGREGASNNNFYSKKRQQTKHARVCATGRRHGGGRERGFWSTTGVLPTASIWRRRGPSCLLVCEQQPAPFSAVQSNYRKAGRPQRACLRPARQHSSSPQGFPSCMCFKTSSVVSCPSAGKAGRHLAEVCVGALWHVLKKEKKRV